ncbi:MAG: single-stranded DNA-binding protein [Lactobacillales bacterium]|nr:single-stranded DNA-binding protein [Lactobacillales bacterium]MDR1253572.1 single-stranded DNA-binding protein [Oscillospiraceae bacterium]
MLNVAILMGRLTADPELKHIPNGTAVVNFTIAVDRSYSKSNTERVTDFINVVAWRGTAEFVSKYFCKGQLIAVQGSLQTRSYQDKDGNNRKTFDIVADNVHFADSKKESAGMTNQQPEYEKSAGAVHPASYESGNTEDFQEIPAEDDLPF